MKKAKVYLEFHNWRGEVTEKCLIATCRNRDWAQVLVDATKKMDMYKDSVFVIEEV